MKNTRLFALLLLTGQLTFLSAQRIDTGPSTVEFIADDPIKEQLSTIDDFGLSGKIKSIEINEHQVGQISGDEFIVGEFVKSVSKASFNEDGITEWQASQSQDREDGLGSIVDFQIYRDDLGRIEKVTRAKSGNTISIEQYFRYDTVGNIIEYGRALKGRVPSHKFTYTFDEKNRVTDKVAYKYDRVLYRIKVSYGDSIRVRRDNYDGYGLPSTILHEVYSERGLEYSRKLIAYGQILNAATKNKFDELNRLIESETVSLKGEERSVWINYYEYEEGGNMPSRVARYSNKELTYVKNYSFDRRGQIIGVKENHFNGHEITSLYKRDENNNVIESYTRLDGQFEQDACRVYKIEYYDQD
jgi:hypothetical protein